jgi:hypothetical protein
MPLVSSPDPVVQAQEIRKVASGSILRLVAKVATKHALLVKPWKKEDDKPEFKLESGVDKKGPFWAVKQIGELAEQATEYTVWQMLEHGTRVRYMMLSDDWESKTKVGQITSGPGRGMKMGLDPENAEGGIHAREFARNIAESVEADAATAVKNGYRDGFRRVF